MESRGLNKYISLDESGELKVKPDVIRSISEELCKSTGCSCIHTAYSRIKRFSRARIKTHSAYYNDVFSVPTSLVKQWTRSMSLVSVPGLYSDLDLEKEDQVLMNELLHRGTKFRALELGSGASLPSLALLGRLIADPLFGSDYKIHLQDYNWQVLASLTLLNFAINLPADYFKALIETKCLRFFYGDWRNFRQETRQKYDLIMMSEVIYNYDNYEALHNLLDRHLKLNGYIVIATKDTYFGLSGGLYSWLDFLEANNKFTPFRMIKVTTTNIPRSILIMKRV